MGCCVVKSNSNRFRPQAGGSLSLACPRESNQREGQSYFGAVRGEIGACAVIFRSGFLPERKTAHILCAALRVFRF